MSETRPNETGELRARESLWDTGARPRPNQSATLRGEGGVSDSSVRRRAVTGTTPRADSSVSDSSVRRRAVSAGLSESEIRRRAVSAGDLSDSAARRGAAPRPAQARGQTRNQRGRRPQRRPQQRPAARGDVFMERRTAVRNNIGSLAITVLLALGIMVMGVMMIRQRVSYSSFRAMAAQVDQHNYFEGVTIEGMNVTGLTLEQTLSYWEQNVEPDYYSRTITLTSGETYTARDLGYSSDYATVIRNAWNAGRRGTLSERYQALAARRSNDSVDYPVTRTMASLDRVAASVEWAAQTVNRAPVDASIQGFDVEHRTFVFNESVNGVEVDEEALLNQITTALENGGGEIEVPVHEIPPEITTEALSSRYGLIASATTNASSSDNNRLENIKLALTRFNGLIIEPGGKFSFNDTVGQRTEEAGFKVAHAYGNGFIIDEVGGGICQVSTTLFNAVVKADLKVTERHAHSMPVAYVDKGKDAAVNWRSKDFCFTNNSDERIYIIGYVNSQKRVKIGIYGRLLEDKVITVEAETLKSMDYKTEYRNNAELAPGKESVYRRGRVGYYAEAYKVVSDAEGNEISRKLLCKSTYYPVNEIIEVGPEVEQS